MIQEIQVYLSYLNKLYHEILWSQEGQLLTMNHTFKASFEDESGKEYFEATKDRVCEKMRSLRNWLVPDTNHDTESVDSEMRLYQPVLHPRVPSRGELLSRRVRKAQADTKAMQNMLQSMDTETSADRNQHSEDRSRIGSQVKQYGKQAKQAPSPAEDLQPVLKPSLSKPSIKVTPDVVLRSYRSQTALKGRPIMDSEGQNSQVSSIAKRNQTYTLEISNRGGKSIQSKDASTANPGTLLDWLKIGPPLRLERKDTYESITRVSQPMPLYDKIRQKVEDSKIETIVDEVFGLLKNKALINNTYSSAVPSVDKLELIHKLVERLNPT